MSVTASKASTLSSPSPSNEAPARKQASKRSRKQHVKIEYEEEKAGRERQDADSSHLPKEEEKQGDDLDNKRQRRAVATRTSPRIAKSKNPLIKQEEDPEQSAEQPQSGQDSEGEQDSTDIKKEEEDEEAEQQEDDAPKDADKKAPQPKNWQLVWALIEKMRSQQLAPVDTEGCESIAERDDISPSVFRFQTLISLMLSSQTKDAMTAATMRRLQSLPEGLTIATMRKIPIDKLADTLYGVSFHRRKAEYIKKTVEILHEKFDDDIPDSLEGLCALPGVGPKMAHLCMQCAWDRTVGIGVDVHVHRISNRLHWVNNTKTPEHTRAALEAWLPFSHWRPINKLLVGFGQTVCTPVGPKCSQCLLSSCLSDYETSIENLDSLSSSSSSSSSSCSSSSSSSSSSSLSTSSSSSSSSSKKKKKVRLCPSAQLKKQKRPQKSRD